ncbi:MAG: peptidylprolyl isomerase [Bacteroidales bacterium]|nr:peptidylprolyl isomerase [Bacteroidales bacterium]
MVLIKTTMGDMKIKLYNGTPYHRDNFIKLVNQGYYNGLLFHRVIEEFMIQGGDPDSKNASANAQLGSGGPGYTLPAEISPDYFHKKGALSAARTGDQGNPTRRSSGSQFYVVTGKVYTDAELDMIEQRMFTKFSDAQRQSYTTVGGTPFLDAQYTVFGEVIEGINVAVNISKVAKNAQDRPTQDVKIISMEVVE